MLTGIDASWFSPTGAGTSRSNETDIAGELLDRACESALGRRLLTRQLVEAGMTALFAPVAEGGIAAVSRRWPTARLAALVRDLGTLAFAPVIRGEVRREPVRRLKRVLGKNYMLPLDLSIWDGRIEKATLAGLQATLEVAISAGDDDAVIAAALDRQGRGELHAWAAQRDPALADLVQVRHPRESMAVAHLPEKPVLFLYSHHESRAGKGA